MRLSLETSGEGFVKQVKALRRHLDSQSLTGGQAQVSARMMIPTLVPFLTVLRTELRDAVMPELVMTAAADLIANIAKTTVQTLIEATPLIEGQTIEQLLTEATRIACQALAQEAEAKKPRLALVSDTTEGNTVIHMKPKGK